MLASNVVLEKPVSAATAFFNKVSVDDQSVPVATMLYVLETAVLPLSQDNPRLIFSPTAGVKFVN